MFKKLFTQVFLVIIVISFFSCTDDNKGFKEYYHPMGNNPVQVIPWLIDVRESFLGNKANISEYTLDNKNYYAAQVYYGKGFAEISPYTIYDANKKDKIIYFHTDDVLASEQDEVYEHFVENAELVTVLWDNRPKNEPHDDIY